MTREGTCTTRGETHEHRQKPAKNKGEVETDTSWRPGQKQENSRARQGRSKSVERKGNEQGDNNEMTISLHQKRLQEAESSLTNKR